MARPLHLVGDAHTERVESMLIEFRDGERTVFLLDIAADEVAKIIRTAGDVSAEHVSRTRLERREVRILPDVERRRAVENAGAGCELVGETASLRRRIGGFAEQRVLREV